MGTDNSGHTLSPSEAIVHEVAERKGDSPEDLNPSLYDVIDPDALNEVFQGDTGSLSFVYDGYVVTVDNSGAVSLEPTTAD